MGRDGYAVSLATGISITPGALHFHERGLTTALEAIREVVGVIGACWVLAYPLVLDELGGTDESRTERAVIFAHPWPASMLAALSEANSSAQRPGTSPLNSS